MCVGNVEFDFSLYLKGMHWRILRGESFDQIHFLNKLVRYNEEEASLEMIRPEDENPPRLSQESNKKKP